MEYTLFPTPIGDCGIAWDNDAVVATLLPGASPEATAARLAARTSASRAVPTGAIKDAVELMTELLEGNRTDLSTIVCDFGQCDPFAVSVYQLARAISCGETRTYGQIAGQLGDKQLARRVGRALGQNPIPIIVPCHRVIGANNTLVGFSAPGGVETKLKMLMIEGARFGDSPGLFDGLSMPVSP